MKSKVFIVRCESYGAELPDAIERLWQMAAWPDSNELTSKRVLVKPNLLTDRLPEQAVTTHPELLRAVVRLLKRAGATITVGDSPASIANIAHVWQRSGIGAVCAEEEVPLIALEHEGAQNFELNGFSFSIARPVLDADLIVNLPKVKSHSLTMLTAAVKNIYGTIPGYSKTMLHRRYHKPAQFGALVKTLWQVMPPALNLADGVVGMEGQGPANGKPKNLGFVAAATDPFVLDRAFCQILHINAQRVPYLAAQAEAERIQPEIIGDTIKVASFSVPSGGYLLGFVPQWMVGLASSVVWVRPTFDSAACKRCHLCVRACPVQALSLPNAATAPILQQKLCISCSCCHEVCPHDAIRMTQSPLLRALKVFKGMS